VTIYVETSAVAKLLVEEAESAVLADHLDTLAAQDVSLRSCLLLETELRRLATRVGVPQDLVSDVLDRFDLVEPDRSVYRDAGLLPGRQLRSLDALHVVTALRSECRTMITYDARQAEAARAAGLRVAAPS
jgi:uncharacterized protein